MSSTSVGVSQKHGVRVKAIVDNNTMSKGAAIVVGQPLRIVVPDAVAAPATASTLSPSATHPSWTAEYQVKATDTLFDIAQSYGLSVRVCGPPSSNA